VIFAGARVANLAWSLNLGSRMPAPIAIDGHHGGSLLMVRLRFAQFFGAAGSISISGIDGFHRALL
jgi:hypothetical protein